MDKLNKKLYRLEYKYGRYAIHNLMIYICTTMLAVYFLQYMLGLPIVQNIMLVRAGLFRGQIWRLITFVFVPPGSSPFWLLISLYFYYTIGSALEQHWGAFKFNMYYLSGILFAIVAALFTGFGDVQYLNLSLFLAFAQLFPDTEFMLFFILPVKAKYLAWLDWALFGFQFLFGGISTKVTVLFAVGNFLLFFGREFFDGFRSFRRYNNATRVNFRRAMRDKERKDRNRSDH